MSCKACNGKGIISVTDPSGQVEDTRCPDCGPMYDRSVDPDKVFDDYSGPNSLGACTNVMHDSCDCFAANIPPEQFCDACKAKK